MPEHAEHQSSPERVHEELRTLRNPPQTPLTSRDFGRDNFFHLTGTEARHLDDLTAHRVPKVKLSQNTPETVLFTELVNIALPMTNKEATFTYVEAQAQKFYLWRAAWQAEGKWPAELANIDNSVPYESTVRHMFVVAKEFLDDKYGMLYDDLLTRTEQLGLFIVSQADLPYHDDGDELQHQAS